MAQLDTLQVLGLEEALSLMGSGDPTGAFDFETERHRIRIYLIDGLIVAAYTNDPAYELGRFVLREGLLDEAHLSSAERVCRRLGEPLDDVLIKTGAVEADALEAVRERHAIEIAMALGLAEQNVFHFEEEALPEEVAGDLCIEVSAVVEEYRKRGAVCEDLRIQFADTSLAFNRLGIPEGALEDHEQVVLELLDEVRSIEYLCCHSGLGRYRSLEALHSLWSQGAVGRAEAFETPVGDEGFVDDPPGGFEDLLPNDLEGMEPWIAEGRRLMEAERYDEGLAAFKRAREEAPDDDRTALLVQGAESVCCSAIYQREFPEDSRIQVLVTPDVMSEFALSSDEAYLLSELQSGLSLRDAARTAPMGELGALQLLRRLKEAGLVVPA